MMHDMVYNVSDRTRQRCRLFSEVSLRTNAIFSACVCFCKRVPISSGIMIISV